MRIFQSLGRQNYIAGLDALRALAIAGVTFFHMFSDTVKGGYLGVSLFFVLTGFLLAFTSVRSWENGSFGLFSYYGKRIKRIYPSLLIMILTTIGVFHFLVPDVVAAIRPEVESVLLGYNNWWQIEQNADYFTRMANASPFTHLWFLGIELQYYLIWPVLFLVYTLLAAILGKRSGAVFFAVLGLGTAAVMPLMYEPGMDVTRLYYGTDTRVYALLLGSALGLWQGTSKPSGLRFAPSSNHSVWKYLAFVLILAVTFLAFWGMDGQAASTYQWGMLLMTLLFCWLIHLVSDNSLDLGRGLEHPLLRWVGRRSYGIFLWQYPVIFLFNRMGWTNLTGYWGLELTAILLLSVWSDAVVDFLMKQKKPALGSSFVVAQCIFFLLVTMPGVALMGYGSYGIVTSSGQKPSELKAKLEAQKIAQEEANARAIAEAAELAKQQQENQAQLVAQQLTGVACIGDSVLLGASSDVRKVLPGAIVDGEVSRYVGGGIPVAQSFEAQGRLGKVVVIALGTNGPIAGQQRYEEQTQELLKVLGPDRKIFWVNIYGPNLTWQDTNNEYLRKLASTHANITVVDWYSEVSKHPEWLSSDGIHPNDEGCAAYARIIRECLERTLSAQLVQ